MKSIIGIGSAAASIIKQLEAYKCKQYKLYTISPEVEKNTKYNFKLPHHNTAENYESCDFGRISKFLKGVENNKIVVFITGASLSSAITLRALEPLKERGAKIEVVYFTPDVEILASTKALQERAIRNILQQYARSGVFDKISLISNEKLETLAGPSSVIDYYHQLNKVFLDSYYMLDVLKNTKPLTSTFSKNRDSSRIATIAACAFDAPDEAFYPLTSITEIAYYFGINENKLKTEQNLFRTITNKVKKRITENVRVSFAIYPTQYEEDYIYAEFFSSEIQDFT